VSKASVELFHLLVILAETGRSTERAETQMHGIIYLIGLIVVILAILSFFGLR
jgi:hypothetical protein